MISLAAFIGAFTSLLILGDKRIEPATLPPSTPSVVVKQANLETTYPQPSNPSLSEWDAIAEKAIAVNKKQELVAYKKQIAVEAKKMAQQKAKREAEVKRLAAAEKVAASQKMAEKKANLIVQQTPVTQVKAMSTKSSGGGTVATKLKRLGVTNASYYASLAVKYGKQYNIDPLWILAMVKTESNFNPRARSSHEAIGLMQILPSTARALGVSPSTLTNPEVSIKTGTRYLSMMQRQFGSLRMATIAYNQGEGNVRRGTYRTWYYSKVQANYNAIKR